MSDVFVYQNARIKSVENRLMNAQQLQRLIECRTADEALKFLAEIGFGSGADNFDAMFEREESAAAALLREANEDGSLDVFLLANDYHNLKAIIKAKLGGSAESFAPDGVYQRETLARAADGSADTVSEHMRAFLDLSAKLLTEDKLSPHIIDVSADKALFADIAQRTEKGYAKIREYFVKKADFANINSFLRCKRLGLDEKFFAEGFVEGGEMSKDTFIQSFSNPAEAFVQKCKFSSYGDLLRRYEESGSLAALEAAEDNELLKMWTDERNDMFSPAPVIAFYLSKQTEIKVIKLIAAGLKNNVAKELIKERMRELYA